MAERKALSKKVRFEVFKRDKFTCQYCGRSSPDVILHVDHIKPVKEGGTNDILNLVTACQECNAGKGARRLSDDSAVKKQLKQVQELAEKNEQLEMFLEWRDGLRKIEDRQIEEVNLILNEIAGKNCEFGIKSKSKVRMLLKKHSFQMVLDCSEAVALEYAEKGYPINVSIFDAIDKEAKQREDPQSEHKKQVYYLRKILINKFDLYRCWDEKQNSYQVISDMLNYGISFEEIKNMCCTCETFKDFMMDASVAIDFEEYKRQELNEETDSE